MTIKQTVTSYVLDDGRLLEMVYHPVAKKTGFVYKNDVGVLQAIEKFPLEDGTELVPLDPTDESVKDGYIKFAAVPGELESARELYIELCNYIKKYAMLSSGFTEMSAVYVLMSWLHERFNTLPYLRVIGAFGSGKSRWLDVMGGVAYKATYAGGSTTTASLFRTVDSVRGTLICDEMDHRFSDLTSEIAKILNGGYTRSFPVRRVETSKDGKMRIKTFYVFGPKILASRERFTDEALESRCITAVMTLDDSLTVPTDLPPEFVEESLELRNKLLTFRLQSDFTPVALDLNSIGIPRLRQSASPLLNIARLIGEDVYAATLSYIQQYEKELQNNTHYSVEVDALLAVIHHLYDDSYLKRVEGRIRVKDIADFCSDKYGSEFLDGKQSSYRDASSYYRVSPRKVGSILVRLGVKTERDRDGFYVPVTEEKYIRMLAGRHGITSEMSYALKNKEDRGVDEITPTTTDEAPLAEAMHDEDLGDLS